MKIIAFEDLDICYKKILDAINKNQITDAFSLLREIEEPIDFWYFRKESKVLNLTNPLYLILACYFKEEEYEIIINKFDTTLFYSNLSELTIQQVDYLKKEAERNSQSLSYFLENVKDENNHYCDIVVSIIESLGNRNNFYFQKNFQNKDKKILLSNINYFLKRLKEKDLFFPSVKLIDKLLDSYFIENSFNIDPSLNYKDIKSIYDPIIEGNCELSDYLKYSLYSKKQYEGKLLSHLESLLKIYLEEGFAPQIKNIHKDKITSSFFNNYFDHVIMSGKLNEINAILLNPDDVEYSTFMFAILMKRYVIEKKKENRVILKKALNFMLEKGLDADFPFIKDPYSTSQSVEQFFKSEIMGGYFSNKTEKNRQNQMISYYKENKTLMEKNYILNHIPLLREVEPFIQKKKRI